MNNRTLLVLIAVTAITAGLSSRAIAQPALAYYPFEGNLHDASPGGGHDGTPVQVIGPFMDAGTCGQAAGLSPRPTIAAANARIASTASVRF